MQKWFSIRFFPLQQSAKRPSWADSAVQTLAVCSNSCREEAGDVQVPSDPELLLGLRSWFGVGSRLPYLLLHAVLSHRVTALGRHLGSVFCQGEKVLEGSSGDLLSQRGQVAGEHRECGGSGGWDPPSQETAPSRGAGGGDGQHRACSAPVLCTEHLQGFTPELKLIFLNAACQQDLQRERGTPSQPGPCSRMEKPFPPVPEADFVLPIHREAGANPV